MITLDKKVERLRAVEYSEKQVDSTIINLSAIGDFKSEDKALMESFKRIYHSGVKQLEKFVGDLNTKGKNVDTYTIKYYVTQLYLGPLKAIVSKLVQGKTYWIDTPDALGAFGNVNRSQVNTPIIQPGISNRGQYTPSTPSDNDIRQDSIVTLTKTPAFIYNNINGLTKLTNTIFELGSYGSILYDNTLPLVDKAPTNRAETEPKGSYNSTPHGNYLVSDVETLENIKSISQDIDASVKEYLGDENYRLYEFNKLYNPYGSGNIALSANIIVKRKHEYEVFDYSTNVSTVCSVEIGTDLTGNTFENENVRAFELKIPAPEKNKYIKLHTVEGQLGGLDAIKKVPINQQG